jgi:hypothetical protein
VEEAFDGRAEGWRKEFAWCARTFVCRLHASTMINDFDASFPLPPRSLADLNGALVYLAAEY